MKITGGSFGVSGKCKITNQGIEIKGAGEAVYKSDRLVDVDGRSQRIRQFSASSFAVGTLVFGLLGYVVFGIVGLLIGLAIAVGGSFYGNKESSVSLVFDDGKRVELACKPSDIDRFVVLKEG